jgi:hypothetical protein
MGSMAIDLFKMPKVVHEEREYDCIVLAVDRLSGWMNAVPELEKGLTSEGVAKHMFSRWDYCGIPYEITSDQGPQFIGIWWKTICASMGTMQTYAHAYHQQSNGRSECTGKAVIALIRKKFADEGAQKGSWVDIMHQTVVQAMNVPGPTGLSPYLIVTGRERPMAGIPYSPLKEAAGAVEYLQKMESLKEWAIAELTQARQKDVDKVNRSRRVKAVFEAGELVWTEAPRNPIGSVSGTKLETKWYGPRTVEARVGEYSYNVQINSKGKVKCFHRDQLKAYQEDTLTGEST